MEYRFKINKRTKGITLSVRSDGTLLVTARRKISARTIEQFIEEKKEWIEGMQTTRAQRPPSLLEISHTKKERAAYAAQARGLVTERLAHFNQHYGSTYGPLSIRNQKTRWGSCSRTGALSFNYRLALLPSPLADYVVVHELCHRTQMNHSDRFWHLVEQTLPDYIARRAALRKL
jgi:predicted metal-dependent hydrolase